MKTAILAILACLTLSLNCVTAQTNSTATKEKTTMHAKGTFDVKVAPQSDDYLKDAGLARMTLDKQLHGDLEGTSKGQMLAFGTGAAGTSGGYVALERVTGTLQGRHGSFTLMHNTTMTKGVPHMQITVVPDSGTDQLAGLAGDFKIIIAADGKHSYEFDYTLP